MFDRLGRTCVGWTVATMNLIREKSKVKGSRNKE
jgi:hypothetical protein